MVNKGVYQYTNRRTKDAIRNLANDQTLDGEEGSNIQIRLEEGTLKKIEKKRIDSDGWIVEVADIKYRCSFDVAVRRMPKYVETNESYIPAEKDDRGRYMDTKVNVLLNGKTKIYKILSLVGVSSEFIFDGENLVSNDTKDLVINNTGILAELTKLKEEVEELKNGVEE